MVGVIITLIQLTPLSLLQQLRPPNPVLETYTRLFPAEVQKEEVQRWKHHSIMLIGIYYCTICCKVKFWSQGVKSLKHFLKNRKKGDVVLSTVLLQKGGPKIDKFVVTLRCGVQVHC